MPEIKTAVINLGGDLIYKIALDPEAPLTLTITYLDEGVEKTEEITLGGD